MMILITYFSNIKKDEFMKDKTLFYFLVFIVIVLSLWIPNLGNYIEDKNSNFFELAILDDNNEAIRYFPDDDQNLDVNQIINWNIFLNNKMKKTEFITLKIKLLNSTNKEPQSEKCIHSLAPTIYEITDALQSKQQKTYPIAWFIKSIKENDTFKEIEIININDNDITINVYDESEGKFRIIVELWVFDTTSKELIFGWKNNDGRRCAWTQIWFEIGEN